jgi:predicted phage terminase large subunit-like protein
MSPRAALEISEELRRRLGQSITLRDAASGRRPCDRGLLAWGQYYLPEHFSLPPSKMHLWLEEELSRFEHQRGCQINVAGPRGSAKSTVVTLAFVLRAIVQGHEPYVWIVSDTWRQASAHLENIKAELTDNRRLARDYGIDGAGSNTWRSGCIRLKNRVVVEAFGTGQRIRGKRSGRHRPTLIVCDDLQHDGHSASAELRGSSRAWFHGTLMKAGSASTQMIHMGTPLHTEALLMQLHGNPGWTSRLFPAIERWPDNMHLWEEWASIHADRQLAQPRTAARSFYESHRDEMDQGAELLWPERESLYTLMRQRVEGGTAAFEREKQCSPYDPELCEWPASYFEGDIWFDQWPEDATVRTMALDPSKGRTDRGGDYSAMVMLAADRSGMLYVDASLERITAERIVQRGVELYRAFRPDVFGLESNQFQELFAGAFEEEFRKCGLGGVRPALIDNRTNKLVRIRRLGPYLASGGVRFKRGSPGAQLLIRQLRDVPIGDHDDGPDAFEMALRLAIRMTQPQPWDDGLGNRLPVG